MSNGSAYYNCVTFDIRLTEEQINAFNLLSEPEHKLFVEKVRQLTHSEINKFMLLRAKEAVREIQSGEVTSAKSEVTDGN